MGRLDRLELENFKSYGGHVIVGPFKGFTAVIGTNGSGKSNLMDAISFVLGVRTTQLRGNQLRDLVYRNLEDSDDDPSTRKAFVKLVYEMDDGAEKEFMRSVTLAGASEYRVDGRVVGLEKYNAELADIGVLVKARNFLVFQNEVENIASKSPKDLTAMFEEISESAELREGYENARAEKDAAEEEVMHFWRKRKGMAAEKRQYKEQKEEADKFRRLQKDLSSAKTERALFQLFHLDKDLKGVKADVKVDEDELAEKEGILAEKEQFLSSEKADIASLDRRKAKLDRQQKRLLDEVEKLRPTEVKYETEKAGLVRRIKGDEKGREKLEEAARTRSSTIESLLTEQQEASAQIAALEQEIKDAEEASVTPESMAEYRSLKEIASTRTSALQQAAKVAHQSKESAAKQKDVIELRSNELNARFSGSMSDAATFRKRGEDLHRQSEAAQIEMNGLAQERARSQEVGGARDQIRMQLEETVAEVTQALRDAKADINQSGRERAFNTAYETMQRLFPGVQGRISDLCKPTQPRYREAVAIVFGKMMDAIVVDNERTGSECISFLKDQRVGMATFIPLQNVRPRPVDESLRRLGGTARLVIDVVEHDDAIRKAVLYAAGNAVVCDSLDEARRLRYDGGRKIKICSLDGTLINKAGFMTGGVGHADSQRAGKWDRAEIEVLKRKRVNAQKELAAIGAAASDRHSASVLAEKIDELRRKISMLDMDKRESSARADAAELEAQASKAEVDLLAPQVQAAVTAYTKACDEVSVVDQRLHGLENELFGDFAERHGIDTVQQFEEQFIRKSESLREKKLEIETKQSRIVSTLQYQRSQDSPTTLRRLGTKIRAQAGKLEQVERNLHSLSTKRTELEDRASKMLDEIQAIRTEREEKNYAINEKRQEFRKDNETIAETRTELLHKRSQLEQLVSRRKKILIDCKVAQIKVPTANRDDDSMDDDDENDDAEDDDEDVVMKSADADKDAENGEARNGSEDPIVTVDVNVVVDYTSLSRRLRLDANAEKRKDVVSSLGEKAKALSAQLDTLAPNMRATEHMTDVQERLGEVDREAEAARERARSAVAAFEELKQSRQDRFNTCFSHVAEKINNVYKALTRSSAYPMGGTAYLSLELQDEPYLGGIKFNAMPPTKRFRDMEQLSGGERTVAALALLFAIHDFRPSPFFVLDEVDAALDNLNVGKVSAYVRSRAPELQTIVISLKDSFYERADALIGIYRDVSLSSSRLLTLDLTKYDDVAPLPTVGA